MFAKFREFNLLSLVCFGFQRFVLGVVAFRTIGNQLSRSTSRSGLDGLVRARITGEHEPGTRYSLFTTYWKYPPLSTWTEICVSSGFDILFPSSDVFSPSVRFVALGQPFTVAPPREVSRPSEHALRMWKPLHNWVFWLRTAAINT